MTRPGMAPLLAVLRDQPSALSFNSSFDNSSWQALLCAAGEENVLPLAAHRLLASHADLTPAQRDQLTDIQRKAHFSSFIFTETLKNVLAAFHRAHLPVIPLKGPVLAERLYGNPALRAYGDLDLLVRRRDLAQAEALLTGLAFHSGGQADDYHRLWLRNSVHLELHHNVDHPLAFDFDIDRAWHRAVQSQFSGIPIQLLAPADELVYLCLHAVRHRFDRLCLHVDLRLAFRSLPLPPPGQSTPAVVRNTLALGWLMAARLDPDLPAIDPALIASAEWSRLGRLADQLWQEHLCAPAEKLDWSAQHRFLLEVESPGRHRLVRRWRLLRILATRVIDADLEFAARFHLHRRWQAYLLRPIRLLAKKSAAPSASRQTQQ